MTQPVLFDCMDAGLRRCGAFPESLYPPFLQYPDHSLHPTAVLPCTFLWLSSMVWHLLLCWIPGLHWEGGSFWVSGWRTVTQHDTRDGRTAFYSHSACLRCTAVCCIRCDNTTWSLGSPAHVAAHCQHTVYCHYTGCWHVVHCIFAVGICTALVMWTLLFRRTAPLRAGITFQEHSLHRLIVPPSPLYLSGYV